MRILIADDEKELLFLLSVSLKNDFFVDTASDADEAKACLDDSFYSGSRALAATFCLGRGKRDTKAFGDRSFGRTSDIDRPDFADITAGI